MNIYKICKYGIIPAIVIWVIIFIMLALLWGSAQAEGLYFTIGVGNNGNLFSNNSKWDDGGGNGAFIAANYQWDEQAWCFDCMPSVGVTHLSQWDVGCPQNCDEYEDSVEHYGIAATWEIFKR